MFKKILPLAVMASLISCSQTPVVSDASRSVASADVPVAYFSPTQGEEAFTKLYDIIGGAKEYVHVSVYSWSDSGLDKALEKALANKAKVRVVLHPDLKKTKKVIDSVAKLEALGAEFKWAPLNMHEKFTLVDDEYIINTSANFSGGAKNKYSEAMIFHKETSDPQDGMNILIRDFKNEFAVIWNTGKDAITHGEAPAAQLVDDFTKKKGDTVVNEPIRTAEIALYSSSMNWYLVPVKQTSAAFKAGKYMDLEPKKVKVGDVEEQTWVVRDVIIEHIKKARKSIFVNLNHFNIRAISDALIDAVKRGVDVRLAVDNQEYKGRPNDLEMTPQFVADWAKIKGKAPPPVRVKYYSHEPSARYWLLNHHKNILIDYDEKDPSQTVLIAGSYNLSQTAEQNQFDSLVVYRSAKYEDLYNSFREEFQKLWDWNRENDKPKKAVLDLFLTPKNNSYPIHVNEAVSLTWAEVANLRKEVNTKAPGIFSGLTKNKDCLYYDPAKKAYWGCPQVGP